VEKMDLTIEHFDPTMLVFLDNMINRI